MYKKLLPFFLIATSIAQATPQEDLLNAVVAGNIAQAQQALEQGASINTLVTGSYEPNLPKERSLLLMAVRNADSAMVNFLLSHPTVDITKQQVDACLALIIVILADLQGFTFGGMMHYWDRYTYLPTDKDKEIAEEQLHAIQRLLLEKQKLIKTPILPLQ